MSKFVKITMTMCLQHQMIQLVAAAPQTTWKQSQNRYLLSNYPKQIYHVLLSSLVNQETCISHALLDLLSKTTSRNCFTDLTSNHDKSATKLLRGKKCSRIDKQSISQSNPLHLVCRFGKHPCW